jgi:hypothetical protein
MHSFSSFNASRKLEDGQFEKVHLLLHRRSRPLNALVRTHTMI